MVRSNCRRSVFRLGFLAVNDLELDAPEAEAAVMTLGLASGEMPEEGFKAWLRDRTAPVGRT